MARRVKGNVTKKEDLVKFIKWCYTDSIKPVLENVKRPHMLACEMFEKEKNIKIKPPTARAWMRKYEVIDNGGDLFVVEKRNEKINDE